MMNLDIWKSCFFFFIRMNLIKTIWLNFYLLPFNQAKYLPIVVYGRLKITHLSGRIIFPNNVKRNMFRIGSIHEMKRIGINKSQLSLEGDIIIKGQVFVGIGSCICVSKDAVLEFGNKCYIGGNSSVFCTKSICINEKALIGSECYIADTSFHPIEENGSVLHPLNTPIRIGKQNYLGTRVIIQKGTITPDYCIICSGSVCTKDYSLNGEKIMIGGVPAKVIRKDINVVFDLYD